jgi:hypothetical protein
MKTGALLFTAAAVFAPMLCGPSFAAGASSGQGLVVDDSIEVQAQIDGRDHLILKGSTAQWHHLDFAAVGRENGGDAPTLIGGMIRAADTSIFWLPTWPSPPPAEIRFETLSSVLQGLQPPIPADGARWQVQKVFGRGDVTIVEQPTPANAYSLIVEFDDNRFGGSAFYGIVLSPAPREVRIDVKPYVTGIGIDLASAGNVRVAMLGDGEFDALQVDPASARFGPGGALPVRYESLDYNRDGYTDRGFLFHISEVGFICGDQRVTLAARAYDGEALAGSDFVHGYNCRE